LRRTGSFGLNGAWPIGRARRGGVAGDGNLDLDRPPGAVDDPDRPEVLEQVHHLVVAGQHQRRERADAFVARAR
jgi:hypothetical protein